MSRSAGCSVTATPNTNFFADNDEVSKLVDSIVDAKAVTYALPMLSDSLGTPTATITLTAIGKSESDVLRVYPETRGQSGPTARWRVQRNNESTGYGIPADKFPAVSVTAALAAREPRHIQARQVRNHRVDDQTTPTSRTNSSVNPPPPPRNRPPSRRVATATAARAVEAQRPDAIRIPALESLLNRHRVAPGQRLG